MDATTTPLPSASLAARNAGITELRSRIRTHWDVLSRSEKAVAAALAEAEPERILWATASTLGAETGTSNATVIRALQRLGYDGLPQLKESLAAPVSLTPEERIRRRMELAGEDMDQLVRVAWEEAEARVADTRERLRMDDLGRAAELLVTAGQVCSYGLGASAIAAAHLALRLARCGRPARHLDADGFRLADALLSLRSGDVLVVFAPGRAGAEVLAAVARAREVGASTILVTDELRGELEDRVSVILEAPHTPTGLTAEPLTALLLVDVLAQAVARYMPENAVETSHALSVIRRRLGYGEA